MSNILNFNRPEVAAKYKNMIKALKNMAFKRLRCAPRTEF